MTKHFLRLIFLPTLAVAADLPIPAKPEYNRDVRPILGDACFRCHGFDKNTRDGGRRLDTREGALEEVDGIRGIVPGKLDDSDLHTRIHSTDKEEIMPPPKANRQLSAREKAILDRWIEQGAEYQEHWAYIPPTKSAPPAAKGALNAIDSFIFARQEQLGLQRVAEADRPTLIRRLYLDLVGLPPTPEEIDAFVKDTAPGAYERLVDRLLASPQFGERMAVWWLDLVRYADSVGYHSDVPRNVSPYRDYVIRAFNGGMPFDRFTIEQVAGDFLPNPTQDQKVASAYNRLILTTEEGGAQAGEYEAKHVTDRVKSIGTTWLAQTFGCCECHDHKFDPVKTRDFYALGAFFADIKEPAAPQKLEAGMPVLTAEQEADLKKRDALIVAMQAKLEGPLPEFNAAQIAWEKTALDSPLGKPWTPLHPAKATATKGTQLAVGADEVITASGGAPEDTYEIDVILPAGTTAVRLEALPLQGLPGNGPGRASNGNFVINEFALERDNQRLKIAAATATFEQQGFPAKTSIDGKTDGKDNGWAAAEHVGKESSIFFELAHPLPQATAFTVRMWQYWGNNHTLGKFRLSTTSAPKPIRMETGAMPADVLAALKIPAAQRNAEQAKKIAQHYRGIAPELAPLRQELADAQKARAAVESSAVRCLITERIDNPRTVRVLPRGDWTKKDGEVVQPATPSYLPGAPKAADGKRLTRLDLAKWLVTRENPLTARVFANRMWKLFYGTGLSKTLEDMGTQAEMPVNQPLLDWLACEFMDSGWNVKHMARLMVTSTTYRLSSNAPKELVARDPFNRELARGGRWRLDAEFVRDNALTISGLMTDQIGGPSVKPYQPPGYWENLNFPEREWANDKDRNQWRRGLYTWWQRTYLQPSLLAFDAPTREECAADRSRSNIPQQALALLNDATYVEAARALAARTLREGGATPADKIAWAFRRATGRVPADNERQILDDLRNRHLALYTQDAEAAKKLVATGYSPVPKDIDPAEFAAWTSVCRAILNLHETITRL